MVDLAGSKVVQKSRDSVSTADTAYPSGSGSAGAVTVPPRARGATTHLLIAGDGSGSAASGIFTIYGYIASLGLWFALAQANGGGAVTTTTKTAIVLSTTDFQYAESLDHISAFDELTVLVTSLTGTMTMSFVFEES